MKLVRLLLAAIVATVLLLVLERVAHAHKPSDAYLTLDVRGVEVHGRWDLALRDVDYAIGLDEDGDAKITWGELRAAKTRVAALASDHIAIEADGAKCEIHFGDQRVIDHSDGGYVVLDFVATCAAPVRVLDVTYSLFFDVDPQHRGLVRVSAHGATRAAAFSAGERKIAFDTSDMSAWRPFAAMVKQGVAHIGQGYDHLLFLLALLFASVLVRDGAEWRPVPRFRTALADVAKIVTAFTVAHSITLTLAALRMVALPSRFVESAIAASVIVAAANNVKRFLGNDRWAAAFALGLLHGFGFSSTLLDLGLPKEDLMVSLFGFNVGVELGQMAVVAVFLPIAFAARSTEAYRRWILRAASVLIALVAGVWLIERAFAVAIFARL